MDGWKEVAAYLGRAERTVKRWEADRGLPIHRVPGGGRASVHAYEHEIDLWLKSNHSSESISTVLPPTDDSQSQKATFKTGIQLSSSPLEGSQHSRRFIAVAVVTACLALCVGTVWSARNTKARSNIRIPKTSEAVSASEKEAARSLYLSGRFEWNKRTPESLNRALDLFNRSIVHDPAAAPAYAGLADTYVLLCEYSMVPPQEAYPRAIAAATKAVELDDSLAEAHRSLGFAEIWGRWDFRGAEHELQRAIELNPRDPLSHLWFATAFESPEWYAITSHEFDLAQELDPSSATTLVNKSSWLFNNGHQQEGIELAQQVERADPDFVAPHRYLSYMYWNQRKYRDFLTESQKAADLQHDRETSEVTAAASVAFQKGGAQAMLRNLYLSRKKQYDTGKLSGTALAIVCLRLGRKDEALQLLNNDFARHLGILSIFTEPSFSELSGDPRYRQLVQKIDFPKPPAVRFD
jgi:tetratricopeptide (TPR) repeat protein